MWFIGTDEQLVNALRAIPDHHGGTVKTITDCAADLIENLIDRSEKAESDAEFFIGEVKLRNRIPATNEVAADLQRYIEKVSPYVQHLRRCDMQSAFIDDKACTCGLSDIEGYK